MKILYIANRKDIFSGGQISLLELISRLDSAKYEPILVTPAVGSLSSKAHSLGIKVEILEMPRVRFFNCKRIKEKINELNYLIKKYDADIVHANGSRAQFYAAVAVRKTRARLVWHVRESVKDLYFYDRFLAMRSDKIICVSDAVKRNRFGRFIGLGKRLETIYNGVDAEVFTKDDSIKKVIREKFNIKKEERLFGIVGMITPRKGHLALFTAIKKVLGLFPDIKLLVVGEAIDDKYYKKLEKKVSELRLEENIIFTGSVKNVKEILSALDAFILPSQREGFSRALLEAMSSEAPIIATNVDGNNEAIVDRQSGLLVPFGDETALCDAIVLYAKDPEFARRMAEGARKRAVEKFSIKKHIDDVQLLYESLRSSKKCE